MPDEKTKRMPSAQQRAKALHRAWQKSKGLHVEDKARDVAPGYLLSIGVDPFEEAPKEEGPPDLNKPPDEPFALHPSNAAPTRAGMKTETAPGAGIILGGAIGGPAERWMTESLTTKEKFLGIDEKTIGRLSKEDPRTGELYRFFNALQAHQKRLVEKKWPDGVPDQFWVQEGQRLQREAEAEIEKEQQAEAEKKADINKPPKNRPALHPSAAAPSAEEAIRSKFTLEQRIRSKMKPGENAPPMTDEEILQKIEDFLVADSKGKLDEFWQEHPWLATVFMTGSMFGPYFTTAGVLSRALGTMRYMRGAKGGLSALGGGLAFGGADMAIQARDKLAGTQDELDFLRSLTTLGAGAGTIKLTSALPQVMKARGWSDPAIRRTMSGMDIAGIDLTEEGVEALRRVALGEENPETMGQTVARLLTGLGMSVGISGVGPRGGALRQKAAEARKALEGLKQEVKKKSAPPKTKERAKPDAALTVKKGDEVVLPVDGKPKKGKVVVAPEDEGLGTTGNVVVEFEDGTRQTRPRSEVAGGLATAPGPAPKPKQIPKKKAPEAKKPEVTPKEREIPIREQDYVTRRTAAEQEIANLKTPTAEQLGQVRKKYGLDRADVREISRALKAEAEANAKMRTVRADAPYAETQNRALRTGEVARRTLDELPSRRLLRPEEQQQVSAVRNQLEAAEGRVLAAKSRKQAEDAARAMDRAWKAAERVAANAVPQPRMGRQERRSAGGREVYRTRQDVERSKLNLRRAQAEAKTAAERVPLAVADRKVRGAGKLLDQIDPENPKSREKNLKHAKGALRQAQEALNALPRGGDDIVQLHGGIGLVGARQGINQMIRGIVRAIKAMMRPVGRLWTNRKNRRSAGLLSLAEGMKTADGRSFTPKQIEQMRRWLLKGNKKVVRVTSENWESVTIEMASGKTYELYHPDSRSQFQARAKKWIDKPWEKWTSEDKDDYNRAFQDAFYNRVIRDVEPIKYVGNHFVNMLDKIPGRDWGTGTKNFILEMIGFASDPIFGGLTRANKAQLARDLDEIKEITFDIHKEQHLYGDDDGLLSEAMWFHIQGQGKLSGDVWGHDLVRRLEKPLRRLQDLQARSGEVFRRLGFITDETMAYYMGEKGDDYTYTHWMYDESGNRQKALRIKAAHAAAFQEFAGVRQVLDAGSVVNGLKTFFQKRERTLEEAIRYGVRTDIDSALEGAIQQIFTANKLRMYERVAGEKSLARKNVPADQAALDVQIAALEDKQKALEKLMFGQDIMNLRDAPETKKEREARSRAAMRLDKYLLRDKLDLGKLERLQMDYWRAVGLDPRETMKTIGPKVKGLDAGKARHPQHARVQDPKVHKWTEIRRDLARQREALEGLSRWELIEGKQYGPLDGMYVKKAVWNELETLDFGYDGQAARAWETLHLLTKKNLTSRNLTTGLKNLLGNRNYNSMAGQKQTAAETLDFQAGSLATLAHWNKTGQLVAHRKDLQPLLDYFRDTGILQNTFSALELARQGKASEAIAVERGKAKKVSDKLLIGAREYLVKFDEALLLKSGEVGKLLSRQEDLYHITDPAMALSLFYTLTTGEGSTYGRKLSYQKAMVPITGWYDYSMTPRLLRSKLGRMAFSFAKFQWKAHTGIPQQFFSAPVALTPGWVDNIVPSARKLTYVPGKFQKGLGKVTQGTKLDWAPLYAEMGLVGALRTTKALIAAGAVQQIFQWMTGTDDEEYERHIKAASNGDPVQGKYLTPLWKSGDRTWFLSDFGIDVKSIPSIPILYDRSATYNFANDPVSVDFFKSLEQQNVIASNLMALRTGKGFFGQDQSTATGAWNLFGTTFLPGTMKRAIDRAWAQTTTGTTKTVPQEIFDVLGVKFKKSGRREERWAERNRYRKEGRLKKITREIRANPHDYELKWWLEMDAEMKERGE